MTQPASLQDVADLSGVSRGTASRALTGTGRVSAGTRARVQAAAAVLNYTTNTGARNLRRARAGSIGLWLPRGLRFMEYYMHFAFGVVEGTTDRELTVTLIPGEFPPERVGGLHVDGFVMADVDGADELARAILDSGKPVVSSELVPGGMPQPTAAVAADHAGAIRAILDHLRAGGARSIALLTPVVDQMWVRDVDDATAAWAGESDAGVHFIRLEGVPEASELRQVVQDMVRDIPDLDAVVCVPEGVGIGILSTLRELGHRVPDDIQLVSYVDSPTLPLVQPPISAMDLRPRGAGVRAAELLISLIEESTEQPPAAGHVERFELSYVQRGSTRREAPA